jgi:hypothetical protein
MKLLLILMVGCQPMVQSYQVPIAHAHSQEKRDFFPDLTDDFGEAPSEPVAPEVSLSGTWATSKDFLNQGDTNRLILLTEPSWCGICVGYEEFLAKEFDTSESFNAEIQVVNLDKHPHLKNTFRDISGSRPMIIKWESIRWIQYAGRRPYSQLREALEGNGFKGALNLKQWCLANNYTPWKVKGDIFDHLKPRPEHGGKGFSLVELRGLTLQELEEVHGGLHAGAF